MHPSFMIFLGDRTSAFNRAIRLIMLGTVRKCHPDLLAFAMDIYNHEHRLKAQDSNGTHHDLRQNRGAQQGCPLGSWLYSLSLTEANQAALDAYYGTAFVGPRPTVDRVFNIQFCDDGTVLGQPDNVFTLLGPLKTAGEEISGELWNSTKCHAWSSTTDLTQDPRWSFCIRHAPDDCVKVLGGFIGNAEAVQQALVRDGRKRLAEYRYLAAVAPTSLQIAFQFISMVLIQQNMHILRTHTPYQSRPAATEHDAVLLHTVRLLLRQDTWLNQWDFQRLQLPFSEGGAQTPGIRLRANIAFLASLGTAINSTAFQKIKALRDFFATHDLDSHAARRLPTLKQLRRARLLLQHQLRDSPAAIVTALQTTRATVDAYGSKSGQQKLSKELYRITRIRLWNMGDTHIAPNTSPAEAAHQHNVYRALWNGALARYTGSPYMVQAGLDRAITNHSFLVGLCLHTGLPLPGANAWAGLPCHNCMRTTRAPRRVDPRGYHFLVCGHRSYTHNLIVDALAALVASIGNKWAINASIARRTSAFPITQNFSTLLWLHLTQAWSSIGRRSLNAAWATQPNVPSAGKSTTCLAARWPQGGASFHLLSKSQVVSARRPASFSNPSPIAPTPATIVSRAGRFTAISCHESASPAFVDSVACIKRPSSRNAGDMLRHNVRSCSLRRRCPSALTIVMTTWNCLRALPCSRTLGMPPMGWRPGCSIALTMKMPLERGSTTRSESFGSDPR
jgi:hypothetical protein